MEFIESLIIIIVLAFIGDAIFNGGKGVQVVKDLFKGK